MPALFSRLRQRPFSLFPFLLKAPPCCWYLRIRATADQSLQACIDEVNTLAHKVKGKIELMDKSNEEVLRKKGCGHGSASERTRTSVTAGLKKKLKDLVGDFSKLR